MRKVPGLKHIGRTYTFLTAMLACGLIVCGPILCGSTFAQDDTAGPPTTEAPFIFATTSDSSMPLAEFRDDVLVAGILKDLGDAIAGELHRKAIYAVVPRKRLDEDLANGSVDGVCYYRPNWVGVSLNWSQPLIPNDILLVTGAGVPRPKRLEDVAGEEIGVVLGYKYPELDVLHQNYQRDDAPNMPANINKLIAGRTKYAIVDKLSLDYQQKEHPEIADFATLSITKINAACGFSLASKIPFGDIDQAIHKLVNEGAVLRILAKFR